MTTSNGRAPFISFSLPVGYGLAPTELVQLIEQADRSGLPGVAVGELASTDSLMLLAAAAGVTSWIRLETSVLSVLSRSPSLLAMSAATMAELSNNRFVLGVGAGSPIVAGYHGKEFVKPVDRVERWIVDVRAALTGHSLEEWGSFRLRGLEPALVPILVAAMNPKILAVAGAHGDGIILNLCGPDQVRSLAAQAHQARADAGVDQPFEVHTTLWADATGDPQRAYERFCTEMAPYLAVPTYRSAVVALSDEDAIDRATRAWREQRPTRCGGAVPCIDRPRDGGGRCRRSRDEGRGAPWGWVPWRARHAADPRHGGRSERGEGDRRARRGAVPDDVARARRSEPQAPLPQPAAIVIWVVLGTRGPVEDERGPTRGVVAGPAAHPNTVGVAVSSHVDPCLVHLPRQVVGWVDTDGALVVERREDQCQVEAVDAPTSPWARLGAQSTR